MKKYNWLIGLMAFFLAALACGMPDVDKRQIPQMTHLAETAKALPSMLPSIFPSGLPTVQLPSLATLIPPGKGLPLPGTLIPDLLGKLSEEEASLAIEAYAFDVLGIQVEVTTSKGMVGDFSLPASMEDGAESALALAGVTYFGMWQNGMGSLSLGSGTASGDLTASIEDASLGIFSLRLDQSMPADTSAALELIQKTYPGLRELELIPKEAQEEVFTFSTNQNQDFSLRDGTITLKGSLISAGVSAVRRAGKITVWATIASGDLAAPFDN